MNSVKHIFWDWNGTLLNDTELCRKIVNNLLRERGKEALSTERYKDIFNFPKTYLKIVYFYCNLFSDVR